MSYRERQRLADIQAAIEAIRSHLERGTLADGLVFDAVRMRLLEIGEAVKALPDDLPATQPAIQRTWAVPTVWVAGGTAAGVMYGSGSGCGLG